MSATLTGAAEALARARATLETVLDPEIPALNVYELGLIRFVDASDHRARVGVTPTYTGCPASAFIRRAIEEALRADGFQEVEVIEVLTPPWSSADLTPTGRRKLEAYGIAPPAGRRANRDPRGSPRRCPRCHGADLECVSEFGSTPCKALYRCRACGEPFDYFKCL
ncbi:MAG TPA: 1,2-phenylacetyl-CoA epoxidase subunit PaaD [Steroidobacteraceae bacterium]|nr:1,2-phenylacetyl-CoA epoxidase subunit PaaD [Steroidobacteraceae bacterium]